MAALEIAGRKVPVTNLDKVLFPATGTTKGQVIEYYAAIADAMLPHLAGRPVTRKRWPNGTAQSSFFEKNLAASAPDWLNRREIAHSDRTVTYPLFSSAADLVWLGQQGAIEAHVPQWQFTDWATGGRDAGPSTRLVFDLDPGDDVELEQCAEVASNIRAMLADIGLEAFPVTSGSKGIHLYVPLQKKLTPDGASTVAKRVATLLEQQTPDLVTATMAKAKRTGKVFVDWSQNNGKKTTVAPYSMRGREEPTVAAPRTWDELAQSGLRQLRFDEVLARFRSGGDLLADMDEPLEAAAPDKLSKYRSMRSAEKTPEPVLTEQPRPPKEAAEGAPIFVIQRHEARALHYDFRLEHDGVLVSWAVPKNIPDSPDKNRLAVHTEDHPMEYATFEGKIPSGQYGGGNVEIWDSGTFELQKWRDDEVIVKLHGAKASGQFALIRTRGDQWLMHLMKDPSVPKNLRPMLATAGDIRTLQGGDSGDTWSFEGKWDGVRVLAEIAHGSMSLKSRNGNDLTDKYSALAPLAADLAEHDVIIDGEAVVFDSHGVSNFGLLQNSNGRDVVLIAFDLLYLDGTSLLRKKYTDRRKLLELLTRGLESVRVPERLTGSADDAIEYSIDMGWEGVVAKRNDSVYQQGKRAGTWIKSKNWKTQEAVIGGWRRGRGSRSGQPGSLLLGLPTHDGLEFIGRVGTGFTEKTLEALVLDLEPLVAESSPFNRVLSKQESADAVWVEPVLICEVRFFEWTQSGHLRHPSWRGLRLDKSIEEVERE